MKKFFAVFLMAAVLGSGAFAQVFVGVSGALHMDEKLSAADISERFQKGDGIFYGPFAEISFGNLGLGLSVNLSFYERSVEYTDALLITHVFTYNLMDYDVTGYVSYHLFGSTALLDPFGELGFGMMATDLASTADKELYNPFVDSPFMASNYWYAALGLGINLGGIGIFGKFSFNYPVFEPVEATYKDGFGGGTTTLLPYGYDEVLFPEGYLPKFRFTLGAKLSL